MKEARSVWHFSPTESWVEAPRMPQDQPKYRLTATANSEIYVVVNNALEVVNPRGGWETAGPDLLSTLPGVEKGYSFEIKPVQTDKGSFVRIESKRFLDEQMLKTVCEDLHIFDQQGEIMQEPQMAKNVFLLTRQHADVFFARVKNIGGKIEEASADIQAVYDSLIKLQKIYQDMDSICTLFRGIMDRTAEGVPKEAPAISERMNQAHYLRDQASDIIAFIRSEKMTIDQQPGQMELKSYAAAYLENAEEWFKAIDKLHREQKSYEIQMVTRTKELVSKNLPQADNPAVTRRYLFIPVVEYYTSLGFDCRLTADGMIIRDGDTTIKLGEKPDAIGSTSETSVPTQTMPHIPPGEALDREI